MRPLLLAVLLGLSLPAAASDPPARLTLSVDLAYRERIALPPGATAEAVLRVGGREVARATAALARQQVPVRLLLDVPPALSAEDAVIEGRIAAPGGMAWAGSRALRLGASADLGLLLLAREARPATLAGPAWIVASIAGAVPAGRRPVTLRFEEGGRMGGQGPCNSYGGQWSLDGGRLSVRGVFSTMMACPEPAMTQERALFRILETARAWSIGEQGGLSIEGEGGTLTARR